MAASSARPRSRSASRRRRFAQEARVAEKNVVVKRTLQSLEGHPLVIGVDRLDYSKGIRERIDAFATFVEKSAAAMKARVTLAADHAEVAIRGSGIRGDATRGRGTCRACQRPPRRRRLDAGALRQQGDEPLGTGRAVSDRQGRPRDTLARRHESRRQGICRRAKPGGSRRARVVAVRGAPCTNSRRRSWSIPTTSRKPRPRSSARSKCRSASARSGGRR